MPKIDELTDDQFKKLLDEYYAPPEARSKMTKEEIKDLARRLNKKINVPIVKETHEEKIIIKVVKRIDNFLYDHLPNEIYDLVRSLDKGIDDKEAKRLIKRLTVAANDKIDIPYLPEAAEYIAIRFIISIIVNAARKKFDLNKAIVVVDETEISDAPLEPDMEPLLV